MDEDYNDQMDEWLQIELDSRARRKREAADWKEEQRRMRLRRRNRYFVESLFWIGVVVMLGAIVLYFGS